MPKLLSTNFFLLLTLKTRKWKLIFVVKFPTTKFGSWNYWNCKVESKFNQATKFGQIWIKFSIWWMQGIFRMSHMYCPPNNWYIFAILNTFIFITHAYSKTKRIMIKWSIMIPNRFKIGGSAKYQQGQISWLTLPSKKSVRNVTKKKSILIGWFDER